MRNRTFLRNSITHIYQRTVDKGVIFYDTKDYLVFLTIIYHYSRNVGIRLGALCFMVNHFHILGIFKDIIESRRFMQNITSVFAKQYNRNQRRSGKIFQEGFGSAPKKDAKHIRTAFAYVNNNPVEKQICNQAEEYPWNFLAYCISEDPFSTYILSRARSNTLKKSIQTVNKLHSREEYIPYPIMNEIFNRLDNAEETAFLRDYIIRLYNPVDISIALSYYHDQPDMLHAFHSNTGTEYDIREDWTPNPDTEYRSMNAAMSLLGYHGRNMNLKDLPEEEKLRLAQYLKEKTYADSYQIAMYLHIDHLELKTNGILKKRHEASPENE